MSARIVLPQGFSEAAWEARPIEERAAWVALVDDVDWLMKQPQFRRTAIRLIDDPQFCGAGRGTFEQAQFEAQQAGRCVDALRLGYLEGRRDAGMVIRKLLHWISPEMSRRMETGEIAARKET